MNILLALLLLLSIAGLVVGLIRPSLFKLDRKRVGLAFGGATLLFFILIGISPDKATPTETATPTPTSEAAPAPVAAQPAVPQTLDQRIAAYAPQVYGKGIAFSKTEKQSDGSVLITLNITDIVGKSTFRTKTGELTARIFQDAFAEYPKAPEVSVIYAGAKSDTYGNTTNGTLMSYFITKPTFAKFNWANFYTFNLCDTLRTTGESEDASADFTDGCAIFTSDLR